MAHVPGRACRLLKEVVLDEDALFASISKIVGCPTVATETVIAARWMPIVPYLDVVRPIGRIASAPEKR